LVHKHWGSLQSSTPEEKLAEIRRLKNDLNAGNGEPSRGKLLFQKHCANCHRLFDEGNKIGPDLTHLNRKDRDYLLVSIVDPSALIRKEFLSYVVHTADGRVLTGLIADQNANTVTLLGAKNERTPIPRDSIALMVESPVSLMPENLLKELKPDEVRDLFTYLQSAQPN
jgi:putative heme-binding domain-containing protein